MGARWLISRLACLGSLSRDSKWQRFDLGLSQFVLGSIQREVSFQRSNDYSMPCFVFYFDLSNEYVKAH